MMKTAMIEIAKQLVDLNKPVSKTSLIFPQYHNKGDNKIRISEQESNILFSNYFLNEKIKFSIEVPTKSKHSFSGNTQLSARYDMATYQPENSGELDWVIELKAHNPKEESFRKDIEKIVSANTKSMWFHTLKNADKRTISTIKAKLCNSFQSLDNTCKNNNQSIIICIVVIEQRYLKLTEFTIKEWKIYLEKNSKHYTWEKIELR